VSSRKYIAAAAPPRAPHGHKADRPFKGLDDYGTKRRRRGKRSGRRSGPKVYLYVPANLNSASVLPARCPSRSVDYLHYLLHLIVRGRVLKKVDRDGYVRLKLKYILKVIPNRAWPEVLAAAVEAGLVERDRRFEKGRKSMGYRLGQAFQVPASRVLCRSPVVATKIRRLREQEFFHTPDSPEHLHLLKWLKRLDIDREAAHRTVLATDGLLEHDDIHQTAIDMIASGHVEFSHCRYGRVHSLATRLARELRPHLRLDGDPLVNLDVKCSQPLLLAKSLIDKHPTTTTQPTHNPPNPTQPTPHTQPTTNHTNTVCNLRTPEAQGDAAVGVRAELCALAPDERLFLDLCERGRLYEFMMEESGMAHVPRQKFKHRFFRDVLYDEYHSDRPMLRVFQSLFPNVARFIRDAKRHDYRRLSWEMQRLESSVIIGTIVRRLMTEYPQVPLITVHDSIATTPPYAELVRQVMVEEFGQIGLRPTIKREPSSEEEVRKSA
jgi:hypothetical protein